MIGHLLQHVVIGDHGALPEGLWLLARFNIWRGISKGTEPIHIRSKMRQNCAGIQTTRQGDPDRHFRAQGKDVLQLLVPQPMDEVDAICPPERTVWVKAHQPKPSLSTAG